MCKEGLDSCTVACCKDSLPTVRYLANGTNGFTYQALRYNRMGKDFLDRDELNTSSLI